MQAIVTSHMTLNGLHMATHSVSYEIRYFRKEEWLQYFYTVEPS